MVPMTHWPVLPPTGVGGSRWALVASRDTIRTGDRTGLLRVNTLRVSVSWIVAGPGPSRTDFLLDRGGEEQVLALSCRVSSHDGRRQLRMSHRTSPARAHDFLLKFLLVGDSDVGKGEILASLQDGASESPYGYNTGEWVNSNRAGGPLLVWDAPVSWFWRLIYCFYSRLRTPVDETEPEFRTAFRASSGTFTPLHSPAQVLFLRRFCLNKLQQQTTNTEVIHTSAEPETTEKVWALITDLWIRILTGRPRNQPVTRGTDRRLMSRIRGSYRHFEIINNLVRSVRSAARSDVTDEQKFL